ncbi:tRNA (adenosine(37)-N6)-dimethylallyltransferase MiaA [Parvibacter caecicola]|uniref:tRNA (adenosine(37)-N6)-dimethylallyltransferase MiaA n=1 Tax=Parvibacter caecicola TaxID=747645 RepID=UPI00249CC7A6|nr:tRNA (adenosine(37)-N6)-dimethylallyltransferase MiaA [Parvibacter caecicola]
MAGSDGEVSAGFGEPLPKPVVVIVGPTASGKSACAIEAAKLLDGEVISVDSMQVYRGMDIGTGKVAVEEREVPHWGLDLVNPGEPYSAALFQEYARRCIRDIADRGKTPILCGGTGFYVRAVIDDYRFPAGEQVDNPVRERYNRLLEAQGPQAVWNLLQQKDPGSAALIHPNNSKRVVRALELLEEGGSYQEQKEGLAHIPQAIPAVQVGLSVERPVLYQRIDQRVLQMLEQGLAEEVKGLLASGFREGLCAPQAIGYKEIVEALEGRATMDEAVAAIQQATRRYAKRQGTWFRRDGRINWIDATAASPSQLALQVADIVSAHSHA